MRILLVSTSFNSMTQRAFTELTDRGYEVVFQPAAETAEAWTDTVLTVKPDVIFAPFLKSAVPKEVWQHHTCIIFHPGIKGDRGPASLDRAIMDEKEDWGVTLLQANEEMDAGDIWASCTFPMKPSSKSRLYRHEVAQAAMTCMLETIQKLQDPKFVPEPLDYAKHDVQGHLHLPVKQAERRIDWKEPTHVVVKKIRAADSNPGVLDDWFGELYYVFGAHEEDTLKGAPGTIVAQRDGAVCRATGDGAVWITHLKKKDGGIKLPSALALRNKLQTVPDLPIRTFQKVKGRTYREIRYEEKGKVGYLHFDFYNGAMSTEQCIRLRKAIAEIKKRDIRVIVIMGGSDFWSNGIHLNVIEHAQNPSDESWRNIVAMNDLVQEILLSDKQLVISAIQGNAGAGGVIMALAADRVYARNGIILNPHYKKMGGLYGSEYWTYLLPRRVGAEEAVTLTEECLPISTVRSKRIGLIDDSFGENNETFIEQITGIAADLANNPDFIQLLEQKNRARKTDEAIKPLDLYRKEELEHMRENFYGNDTSYHIARHTFVHKISCIATAKKQLQTLV
jgi:putative two-component system hydrogenase maturation factor HypX/HoxX